MSWRSMQSQQSAWDHSSLCAACMSIIRAVAEFSSDETRDKSINDRTSVAVHVLKCPVDVQCLGLSPPWPFTQRALFALVFIVHTCVREWSRDCDVGWSTHTSARTCHDTLWCWMSVSHVRTVGPASVVSGAGDGVSMSTSFLGAHCTLSALPLPHLPCSQATSTRRVDDFVWTQDEDHKDSIAAVLRELREQLDLPDTLALIDVTTLIAYDVDAVVGDKRTRIVGKTDYFIVLKDAAAHVKRSPSQFKPYVVLIVETKTAKALADEYSKSLGSAALQCVAANFELQQQGIQRPPDGLPVLLTDMNSFFMFVCDGDRSVVRQICYPNKAVAYDQIAIKARELGAFVLERQTRATAAAGARSSRPFGGASGGGGSGQSGSAGGSAPPPPPSSDAKGGGASTGTDLESAEPPSRTEPTDSCELYTSPELAEADMAFAIHNVRAAFCPGSQECGDVLIETFDSALGRSLQQRHNLPMSKPVFRAAPRALVPGLR
eukprot:TRINITY_DN925_c0_g1_i6.p1 TRINITY_DN925_c0_g1~~TRINITY_DN925_c0_g1_i6.p1  ORF type:complete len:491 (-),score=41.20 TRINITY_DN925_c0_g1_i6:76-1548(-)